MKLKRRATLERLGSNEQVAVPDTVGHKLTDEVLHKAISAAEKRQRVITLIVHQGLVGAEPVVAQFGGRRTLVRTAATWRSKLGGKN